MKIRILGCGASGGVPLITGEWGQCNPHNSKNHRLRSSLLVEVNDRLILIDTSPDLRQQLLQAQVSKIDAVLYTHAHADHIGGIDDLRQIYVKNKVKIPIYADSATMGRLVSSYGYALETFDSLYPSFLEPHLIELDPVDLGNGILAHPFSQLHGHIHSLGFRMGNFAYSTDFSDLPEEAFEKLKDLDLWIVDCLRDDPHISHSHVSKTLELIERVKPRRAILTHMAHNLDYDELKKRCPAGVEPAFDTLEITV